MCRTPLVCLCLSVTLRPIFDIGRHLNHPKQLLIEYDMYHNISAMNLIDPKGATLLGGCNLVFPPEFEDPSLPNASNPLKFVFFHKILTEFLIYPNRLIDERSGSGPLQENFLVRITMSAVRKLPPTSQGHSFTSRMFSHRWEANISASCASRSGLRSD